LKSTFHVAHDRFVFVEGSNLKLNLLKSFSLILHPARNLNHPSTLGELAFGDKKS